MVSSPIDHLRFAYSPSEGDDLRATRIKEARIGADGDWYCLVQFEALGIKNRYPGKIKYGPYLIPGGGIYILPARPFPNDTWYKAVTGSSNYAYNPNTESISNIFQYKAYSRYMPTQTEGAFMWLKANYVSPTEIGLVNNPGSFSVPSDPTNKFQMTYTVGVTTKLSPIEAKYWYVVRGGGFDVWQPDTEVVVDLKINRPN